MRYVLSGCHAVTMRLPSTDQSGFLSYARLMPSEWEGHYVPLREVARCPEILEDVDYWLFESFVYPDVAATSVLDAVRSVASDCKVVANVHGSPLGVLMGPLFDSWESGINHRIMASVDGLLIHDENRAVSQAYEAVTDTPCLGVVPYVRMGTLSSLLDSALHSDWEPPEELRGRWLAGSYYGRSDVHGRKHDLLIAACEMHGVPYTYFYEERREHHDRLPYAFGHVRDHAQLSLLRWIKSLTIAEGVIHVQAGPTLGRPALYAAMLEKPCVGVGHAWQTLLYPNAVAHYDASLLGDLPRLLQSGREDASRSKSLLARELSRMSGRSATLSDWLVGLHPRRGGDR